MTPPLDKARGLPELPKSLFVGQTTNQPLYTATQLQEYGQRCIDEAHTALVAEVERLSLGAVDVIEPGRYFAGGPEGSFFTDDLAFAERLIAAFDRDDWTITDLQNPTAPAKEPQS